MADQKNPPLKIVADENTHGVVELFSPYGDVVCLPGRSISASDVQDADVLLVRSVTRVNEALLAGSSVRFVGSATIGVDHVDTTYLASRGIQFAHAPGCNARAVVEYVLSCLAVVQPDWQKKSIGVVGCGNVGGLLLNTLRRLGVNAMGCDPFLDQSPEYMVPLEQGLDCDVISLHTPLTRDGDYPTFQMLNKRRLSQINPGALLINAGRGEVIEGNALLDSLRHNNFRCVLDVWENEPAIDSKLLDQVTLGTPHIAGYSLEGKLNGTRMVFQAFCQWLGAQAPQKLLQGASEEPEELDAVDINLAILQVYDVRRDDRALRQYPGDFDTLRKNYQQRMEFSHFRLTGAISPGVAEQAELLGFRMPR